MDAMDRRHEAVGRRRAFGETGNKRGGDDHQAGRIEFFGKPAAE